MAVKFILDENVSPLIEDVVHSLGHTFLRFPQGTKDRDLISFAQKEKAAIISHDKDFLVLSPSGTKGVLLIRIHPPWEKDVASSLKNFLATTSLNEWKGKLVLLERTGFHIRF